MKNKFLIGLAVLALVVVGLTLPAQSEDFQVSTNVPQANSANFVIWWNGGAGPVLDFENPLPASTPLSFGLQLQPEFGSFLAGDFYAIDVAPVGAGQLNVAIDYTDTENPNGSLNETDCANDAQSAGLTCRAYITPVKAEPTAPFNETVLSPGSKGVMFAELNTAGYIVPAAILEQAPAGFLRVYVALVTGEGAGSEPTNAATGAVPFNVGDTPGDYTGTLTFSVAQP